MKITVHGGTDMRRALEAWIVPETCEELILDAPQARRFTNCLLNSLVTCRVTVKPTENDAVSYAGLFSGCRYLVNQPMVDVSKCINLAAFLKSCRSARFNLYHFRHTARVRDMRQCLWGCENISGIGLQAWDFSGLSSEDSMRNFAGNTNFQTRYYDSLIENLYSQAKAGTLPTPMRAVDFGSARYSPVVAPLHKYVVDYGWEILDGGPVTADLSPTEKELSRSVDSRLTAGQFPGTIDLSPMATSSRNGILISPQHVLYVRHYQPRPGQAVTFWGGEKAVVASCTPGDWDVAVATLRDPVAIRPALVFGVDWEEKMPLLAGPPSQYPAGTSPPVVWKNRNQQIGVADLMYARGMPPTSHIKQSADPKRAAHSVDIRVGDSGSPCCCVIGDRLVVAHALADSRGMGVFTGGITEWLREVTQNQVQFL